MILNGAGTRSRTRDLLITSQLLYQLSYTGLVGAPLYPFVGTSKATFKPHVYGPGYQQRFFYAQREGIAEQYAPLLCASSRFFASLCFSATYFCGRKIARCPQGNSLGCWVLLPRKHQQSYPQLLCATQACSATSSRLRGVSW
ncbi:conserved protein of unknown function [Ectopseudomonas oleovorans]|uniref:Uncharacterized protein n=1 Tax=Ectopseudomonas oleovorans TaxID=301 RepID=A0A653B2W4_ECTOL|nr:conserved protein of unknown function [Pseudomonas oleovorans]